MTQKSDKAVLWRVFQTRKHGFVNNEIDCYQFANFLEEFLQNESLSIPKVALDSATDFMIELQTEAALSIEAGHAPIFYSDVDWIANDTRLNDLEEAV